MKRHILSSLLLALCVLCVSCKTRYAPYSEGSVSKGAGGFDEMQVGADKWRVTFSGNGYTDAELVDRYALYRCAELTIERGFDNFTIVNDNKDAEFTVVATPVRSTPNTVSDVVATSAVMNYAKKHAIVKTIQMYKGKSDDANAYDAHLMVKSMASKIDR